MATVEERISFIEVKMEAVADLRALLVGLDQKMDQKLVGLDQKMDRHFMWVIGIQVTTLLTLVAGLFGIVATLLRHPL